MTAPSSTLLLAGTREPLSSHGDDGKPYKIEVGAAGGLKVEVVGGAGTTGSATAANQVTEIASLASILAKLSADPATQTTLAAVLAKLSADPATQTTLAAVLARLATVTPGDADANAAGLIDVCRLQGWDPEAGGGAGAWRRILSTSTGLLIVDAALVDANTGFAFDSSNPLPISIAYIYRNITSATTTLVRSGSGILRRIMVNKAEASATVKICDALTDTTPIIGTATMPATLLASQSVLEYDIAFTTGLTIVTTGAQDLTVVYSNGPAPFVPFAPGAAGVRGKPGFPMRAPHRGETDEPIARTAPSTTRTTEARGRKGHS